MGIGVAEIVIILVVLVFVLGIPLVAGIALWSIYKRLMDVEIKLVEINARIESIQKRDNVDQDN